MTKDEIKTLEKMFNREMIISNLNFNGDEDEIGSIILLKNKLFDIISKEKDNTSLDKEVSLDEIRINIIHNLKEIYDNSDDPGIKIGVTMAASIVDYHLNNSEEEKDGFHGFE